MDDEQRRVTRTLGGAAYAPTATPPATPDADVGSAPTLTPELANGSAGSPAGTRDLPPSDQAAAAPSSQEMIGHFVVRARLGEGGMGVVYAGVDADLGRPVAIKLVRDEVDNGGYRARLLREAQAMARLEHPNVVRVYEIGNDSRGRLFVAMELVEGETLSKWLAARRHDWRAVVGMFAQVGAGLSAVHRAGLVHRDFKPDNVLVDRTGRARVADFGLARLDPATATTSPMQSLTRTGAVMGTPGFMAPEQQFGADVDARADQYSYCVALRAALGGKDQPGVPERVRAVVARGLAYDPSERWASMDELLGALARAAGVHVRRERRGVVVAIALVAVVAGGIATVAAVRSPDKPAPIDVVIATPQPTPRVAIVPDASVAVPAPPPVDAAIAIAPKIPPPKVVQPKIAQPGIVLPPPAPTSTLTQNKLPAADVTDPGHIAVVRATIRDLGYDGVDLAALDADPKAAQAAFEAESDADVGKVELGMLARRRGDCATASTLFTDANAKLKFTSPWSARAWMGLGLCSLATKQPADGLEQVKRSWNHGNQDEVFLAWGVASYDLGDKQTALAMFATAKHKQNARVQAGNARWLAGTGLALP